ncbi:MAG: diacylglycerol kinase [Rhizobiaceae bacterium]|nr:diacylglycerol kinase [Rhizobiaceae bacterium]
MKRLIAAFYNSVAGLRHGFGNETAIRQEIILILFSLPVVPVLTLDPWHMLLLWGSLLFILLTELLNTGIEEIANKITREFAPEIKIAKDCGSAAVLIATLLAAAVWAITVWEWWFS